MNIRVFLFQEQLGRSTERTANTLKYVFRDFLPDDKAVLQFSSIKDAVNDMSSAFKDAHVILFLTAPELFSETKKKLSKSFNLSMEVREELQSKAFATLNKIIPNASEEEYLHCVVPANSRVFCLADGLYSGFSMASGNQTMLFLPYMKGRTEYLLSSQVIPYINSAYHTEIIADDFRKFNCAQLEQSLKENDYSFGLALTNTTQYFKDYISGNELIQSRIKDTGRSEKRGTMSPEDYIVNLSITAKEFTSATFGVAMSNAYYTGEEQDSEKVIYLAVTSDKKTSLREVRSVVGEPVEDFLSRASGDLCVFASDILDTASDTVRYVTKVTEKKVKKYKVSIAVTTAIIAVLAVGIALIFTRGDYTFKQWFENRKIDIFPGQTPIATTAEATTVETTETSSADDESTTLTIAG